jgi:hypothetical protein
MVKISYVEPKNLLRRWIEKEERVTEAEKEEDHEETAENGRDESRQKKHGRVFMKMTSREGSEERGGSQRKRRQQHWHKAGRGVGSRDTADE